MDWYPSKKKELNEILDRFLEKTKDVRDLHGLVVPHAGYEFSGKIAGKAFGLLKGKKFDKVVVLGPSHYAWFEGVKASDKLETPLGKVNILKNNFEKIGYEHSVENQIPFLQKLNPDVKILSLVIGNISDRQAKKIAEQLLDLNAFYVFSTDLSHFLPYDKAVKVDKETIKIIEKLDIDKLNKVDACGKFPLLILMHLCRLKNWKPKLIEYKNSGDITGDKSSVVGYANFWF